MVNTQPKIDVGAIGGQDGGVDVPIGNIDRGVDVHNALINIYNTKKQSARVLLIKYNQANLL